MLRDDGLQCFERSKCFFGRLINTGSDTGAFGCSGSTVCVMQQDGSTADTRQRLAEDRREEHVGIAGMDSVDLQTHLLHDLDTIHKTEHDALLGGT